MFRNYEKAMYTVIINDMFGLTINESVLKKVFYTNE